jgi:hypothetical protein
VAIHGAVTSCEWSARVERATGVWFDLHLTTASYYAEDPKSGPNYYNVDGEDENANESDWESKTVWCNYHSCILSSTYWPGNGFGFLAGSKGDPLDMTRISKKTFAFDDDPADLAPPRPFGIYLTGHDAVSAHRVHFKREPHKRTYAISWSGKIAMSYAGSDEFNYSFDAKIKGVRFGGLNFPAGIETQDAREIASPFVVDLYRKWQPQKTKTGLRFMPK